MVRTEFFRESGRYTGFKVSGHAMPPGKDSEYDLICAAVSSAVYLTCNTLTDCIGGCSARQSKNEIVLSVEAGNEPVQAVIRGFHEHLREMARQYPGNIQILGG